MADPGSDGPLECRTLGVSDHGSGGPKPSVVLVGIQCQFDSPSPSVSILRQMVQFLQSSQVNRFFYFKQQRYTQVTSIQYTCIAVLVHEMGQPKGEVPLREVPLRWITL